LLVTHIPTHKKNKNLQVKTRLALLELTEAIVGKGAKPALYVAALYNQPLGTQKNDIHIS
jgi:hypothetical protein